MYKILIADDEIMERKALTDLVARRFGHKVEIHTAENGRRAHDMSLLLNVDLILMDIEMPGINGLEAARQVIAKLPGCKVIFVTAYGLFQYAYEAMRLGACGYILKPVVPDEAESVIRKALVQIESERKLAELAPAAVESAPEPDADAIPDKTGSKMELLMQQVKTYIDENYMYELSLDSVGDILHISPAYLSSQFKKYLHIGFLDYLTEVRIRAACDLLSDPLRSTTEVAGMVGYGDANYFARTFKKHTGQTPTQYRREAVRNRKGATV